MKTRLLTYFLTLLLRSLTPEQVKILLDDLLDKAEDLLKDNSLAMEAMGFLRIVLNIPDDIDGDTD